MIFNFHYLLIAVLSCCFFIQLLYFFYFFIRLTFHKTNKNSQLKEPVSVIIAARNESENIENHLPLILNQDYPDFEVIVVNDRSWDSSEKVLEKFKDVYNNLKIVTIPDLGKDNFSKKFAITLGIKAAKNDLLLFIDADCFPNSTQWISTMSISNSNQKMISLGAGPYKKGKGLLNALIRFDAVQIAIQYLSMAKAGLAYMGVGRNLSYKKEIYNKLQGFKSHYHIASGDDDLFVNQSADSKNTQVVFDENSITFSIAEKSLSEWIKQKSRHLKTSHLYKNKTKILISIYPISIILLYLACIGLYIGYNETFYIFSVILTRSLIQIILFFKPLKIMGSKELIIFTPLLELLLLLIYPFFHLKKIQNP